jgi:TPR repeat protein
MSGLNAIAPPTNHCRAGAFTKSGFYRWLPLLVSSCVWSLGPSVAECAPQSRTTASPRLTPPSAAEMLKRASRFGGSITRNTEGGEFDRRESSALNPLGIRYAKGQGVKRDPAMAKRFFLRSAIQGYTPAMANLGTLYEIGAKRYADFQRAYAWARAALSFGVP